MHGPGVDQGENSPPPLPTYGLYHFFDEGVILYAPFHLLTDATIIIEKAFNPKKL
jgi:hypothetical protein